MDLSQNGKKTVAVKAENLVRNYGKNRALKGVSFEIGEREIVGLIGPNGAGKSTTMNILSGYLPPSSGKVQICGIDLLKDPLAARSHIGYLPEIPPLYADMTVAEQIRFACRLSKVPKRGKELDEYVTELCDKTHVTHMKKRLIRNLSKGYRQRVAVAQLLAGDPQILILDEPTVGLDPRQIREFRDLFLELGQTHTVIFSSHILSEINSICSRVLIFDQGEILADGEPEQLQQQLSGEKRLLLTLRGSWEEAAGRIRQREDVRLAQVKPGEDPALAELVLSVGSGEDFPEGLSTLIADAGCEILLMQPETVSLEDLYLNITRTRRQT